MSVTHRAIILGLAGLSALAVCGSAHAQRNTWQQQQHQQQLQQQQRQQQLLQQQRHQQMQAEQQRRMQEMQVMRQRLEQQRAQVQQQQQRMQELQQQRMQQLQAQRQQLQQRQAEQQRLQEQRQAQQRQIEQKRVVQGKEDERRLDEAALARIKGSQSTSAFVPYTLQARLGAVAQRVMTDIQQRRALQQAGGLGSAASSLNRTAKHGDGQERAENLLLRPSLRISEAFRLRLARAVVLNEKGGGASFRSPEILAKHYLDHGRDFGSRTVAHYRRQADRFLTGPRDANVLEKISPTDGDVIRLNPKSDEFGVITKDGVIRTYFKPDPAQHKYPTNLDYYNAR